MRVLLTGGAGFMGSQVARELVGRGHEVRVFDLLTYAGRRENIDGVGVELVVGDVCDPPAIAQSMVGCDAVIHMAAESHVTRSLDDPSAFIRTNVEGTRVVLDTASQLGVPRFIHISTDEVFGSADDGQVFEVDSPLCPGNPYAASKVGAEALLHAWRHSYGYSASVVRCTNNYGPRQHPEKAIPSWIMAASQGGPVPVHGDGSAIRDWLHVEDFARGVGQALDRWAPGRVWHFAGRQPLRNRDMAERVAAICGGAELVFGPERQGQDARYAIADERTRHELDWRPRVSLEEGLRVAVGWYREHGAQWS